MLSSIAVLPWERSDPLRLSTSAIVHTGRKTSIANADFADCGVDLVCALWRMTGKDWDAEEAESSGQSRHLVLSFSSYHSKSNQRDKIGRSSGLLVFAAVLLTIGAGGGTGLSLPKLRGMMSFIHSASPRASAVWR